MRILYFLPVIFLIAACNGNNEEVAQLEDIMPTSNYDKTKKTDTIPAKVVFTPSVSSAELEAAQIKWDSVVVNDTLTIPERFSPKKMEKFTYWTAGKSVEYYRWSFPDSSKTMKAFLNWMNCYGERCLMVQLRTNANIQRNAFLILQNDTSIVQIQSPSIGLAELKKWKKLYFTPQQQTASSKKKAPKVKWNYVITQPRGGKAIWSQFKDEEEQEFVQLETK
ncbi:MAG: hypothetical protein KF704_10120 [Crocinitomicaceae bacterium]|nr:hypothetical protein [Crocinitomicaceae bacterium]